MTDGPAMDRPPWPITVEVETKTIETIAISMEVVAKWFCALSDEQQADFFIAVSAEAKRWGGPPDTQWWYVGRHLRTCACSTDEARDMIRSLHGALSFEDRSNG